MNKHFKEFIFIIISISPLFLMSLVSNLVEAPTEISYEGLDRKMLLLSNSFLLFFFLLPYFAIRKNSSYSMNLYRIKLIPIFIVIASTLFFIILNAPVIEWNKSISFPLDKKGSKFLIEEFPSKDEINEAKEEIDKI